MNLDGIESIVLFVGNPRAGTTLVRSLLNAHPSILLANEANMLALVRRGLSFEDIARRIAKNEAEFAIDPVWTDYRYELETASLRSSERIRIIGDKKAAWSAREASADPLLIDRLQDLAAGRPLQLIHCIRHPLDCIATRMMRGEDSSQTMTERFFEVEHAACQVIEHALQRAESNQCHHVYLEELIAEPSSTLSSLLTAMGCSASKAYLEACAGLIKPQPNRTRERVDWTAPALQEVKSRAGALEHLRDYLDDL